MAKFEKNPHFSKDVNESIKLEGEQIEIQQKSREIRHEDIVAKVSSNFEGKKTETPSTARKLLTAVREKIAPSPLVKMRKRSDEISIRQLELKTKAEQEADVENVKFDQSVIEAKTEHERLSIEWHKEFDRREHKLKESVFELHSFYKANGQKLFETKLRLLVEKDPLRRESLEEDLLGLQTLQSKYFDLAAEALRLYRQHSAIAKEHKITLPEHMLISGWDGSQRTDYIDLISIFEDSSLSYFELDLSKMLAVKFGPYFDKQKIDPNLLGTLEKKLEKDKWSTDDWELWLLLHSHREKSLERIFSRDSYGEGVHMTNMGLTRIPTALENEILRRWSSSEMFDNIDLSHNSISKVENLGIGYEQFSQLNLSHNNIKDLEGLPMAEHIYIDHNPTGPIKTIPDRSKIKLQVLHISRDQLYGSDIADMQQKLGIRRIHIVND